MATDKPNRSALGVLGDLLAASPGKRLGSGDLVAMSQHGDMSRVVPALIKAKAVSVEPHPKDRRRHLVYMTDAQAQAWLADGGAALGASAGAKAAPAVNTARTKDQRQQLRFGVWSDGALMIDGLARKQLTLPAVETAALALTLSAMPEGTFQALCDSPLRPAFSLRVDGRDYALTADQTADLVQYIEQLPSRVIKAPGMGTAFPGLPRPGTDHRSHRIETEADRLPAEGDARA